MMRQVGLAILSISLITSVMPAFANINPYMSGNIQAGTGNANDLLQNMQQQTQQALQIFQNVNYKKLSGNEDQQAFFQSDAEPSQSFTIPGVQS